jgi:chitodextrinase
MLYWHNPFPIYDATYIFKVLPHKKVNETNAHYYTMFFWGNDGTFFWDNGNFNTYYGMHPYPSPSPFGTPLWEISVNGNDFTNNAVTGLPSIPDWDRWHTQVVRVWRESPSITHHEFYYDWPDMTKVITHTVDDPNWAKNNPTTPAIMVGQAPDRCGPVPGTCGVSWGGFPGWEEYKGVIRGVQMYSGLLSLSDISAEVASPESSATGVANIWYLNLNPRPSDTTDKKGIGVPHNPAWDGTTALEWSSAATPTDTVAPSVPTDLSASAASTTTINLSWTASTDNVGVTGYRVFRNGVQVAIPTTTTYSDTGLTASTTYAYTVAATDAAGNVSALSSSVNGTTQAPVADTIAPSIPASLTATAVSSTQINLSWTASNDNVGVTGYRVFRNDVQVGTPTTTSYSDTGLTASTTYAYTVAATDAAGNVSALSTSVNGTTQAPPPPVSGLMVSYNFDEGVGTVLNDISGNNHPGTLVSSPAWITGANGGGLSFNGSTSYVTAGDVNTLDGLTNLTVAGWIKTTATTEKHIVDKSACDGVTNGGPFEFGTNFFTPGKLALVFYKNGGAPNYYWVESSANVNDGVWHKVAGTYDGTSLKVYVDGVLSGTSTAPGVTLSSTSNALEIGGHCNGNAYIWSGAVDDVRVYNRALSASEVAAL